MDVWAQRGQVILITVAIVILVVYLMERLVFHTVVGWSNLLPSGIILVVMSLLLWLTYQGIPGVRWLLGVFLILNSLGTPVGLAQVFGDLGALLIALFFLLAQVGSALVLCLAPGIPSFMRHQRQRRRARKPASPAG
jgi:hypothetical protein